MSGDDEFDPMVDDLIERYLLFLRGKGPEPDLSALPPGRRAQVLEQQEIVAALADRDPVVLPIEGDPVALRLGLVLAAVSDEGEASSDAVSNALHELLFRFNHQITVDFAPTWASQVPPDMHGIAQCSVPGETVAVLIAAVDEWSQEPETVARFFHRHPDVSAVALVSQDAERAVVVTAADAHHSVDPLRGWLAPHSPGQPEPLGISLGRHFDQCIPRWERVAGLEELLALGDLTTMALETSAAQIAEALRTRPRLAHKKEGLQALKTLDASTLSELVVAVQEGRLAGDELIDRVALLAEAAAP